MRILVVNPNTTGAMTALIERCARAAVGPGVTVDAVNPVEGPESIESRYDEAAALPQLMAEVRAGVQAEYDGFVIACFGDPGLLAAREIAPGPVVGIAEAGLRTATYLARRISVVTTLPRAIGYTWDLAHQYGLSGAVAGVHACEIRPVDLLTHPGTYAVVRDACRDALETDRSKAVVLGCAGMADLSQRLTAELRVPVIDGVAAATAEIEKLLRLGLRTSRIGEYPTPPVKTFG